MSYRIEYLPSALHDLTDIASYIGVKLQNPQAADRLADNIISAIDGLADMPYRFPIYYPVQPLLWEYRKLVVENYAVFYRVEEGEKTVTVARVLYGGRRIEDILE